MKFFTYPQDTLPDLSNYLLLTPDAPPLSPSDRDLGIFLIDGTWRYAAVMLSSFKTPHAFVSRSLPRTATTAYPRRQDQSYGLSSIEALFLAYTILGRDVSGLLDRYHWKEQFLQANDLDISPIIS